MRTWPVAFRRARTVRDAGSRRVATSGWGSSDGIHALLKACTVALASSREVNWPRRTVGTQSLSRVLHHHPPCLVLATPHNAGVHTIAHSECNALIAGLGRCRGGDCTGPIWPRKGQGLRQASWTRFWSVCRSRRATQFAERFRVLR